MAGHSGLGRRWNLPSMDRQRPTHRPHSRYSRRGLTGPRLLRSIQSNEPSCDAIQRAGLPTEHPEGILTQVDGWIRQWRTWLWTLWWLHTTWLVVTRSTRRPRQHRRRRGSTVHTIRSLGRRPWTSRRRRRRWRTWLQVTRTKRSFLLLLLRLPTTRSRQSGWRKRRRRQTVPTVDEYLAFNPDTIERHDCWRWRRWHLPGTIRSG